MSPSHGVRWWVVCLAGSLSMFAAIPVQAQAFEDPRISFDLTPDPLARSPRLLGLGRLSLTLADPHNRINLWDFAGNPAGLFDSDSVSTLELRPGTGTASSVREQSGAGLLRQFEAANGVHVGFEAWRREQKTVYGAIGDVGTGQLNQPYGDNVEQRSISKGPGAMPIISGVMPYTKSGRARYAVRLITTNETIHDEYRLVRSNSTGGYIDQNGEQLGPPNLFTPDRTRVSTLGAGIASSYRFGSGLVAAYGLDVLRGKYSGENTSPLYEAQVRERRPYLIGQFSVIGRIGKSFEWGEDARGWKSSSQQNWGFSVSQGAGAIPLVGRGKLLEREEKGSTLRTRARWLSGGFEVGAGFNTGYRRIGYTPPDSNDPTSLNHFLNTTYTQLRSGADFPDSVIANRSEVRLWEAGGGVAWHLPSRRCVVGAEYHRSRSITHHEVGGEGPRRVAWDVRGGLEYVCTRALTGRVGYQYSWEDRDEFTRENEYRGNTLTLGAGLHPAATAWTIETGYAIRWEQADFGDPGKPRGSRQQLAVQARWSF